MFSVNDIHHAPADADWRETDDRLLLWPEVKRHTGVSRTTAWRMERAGGFPERVQLSPGRVGWWESDVAAWKMSRRLARLAETARGRDRPCSDRAFEPPLTETPSSPLPVHVTDELGSEQSPVEDLLDTSIDRPDPPGTAAGTTVKRPRRATRVAPGQLGFDF